MKHWILFMDMNGVWFMDMKFIDTIRGIHDIN